MAGPWGWTPQHGFFPPDDDTNEKKLWAFLQRLAGGGERFDSDVAAQTEGITEAPAGGSDWMDMISLADAHDDIGIAAQRQLRGQDDGWGQGGILDEIWRQAGDLFRGDTQSYQSPYNARPDELSEMSDTQSMHAMQGVEEASLAERMASSALVVGGGGIDLAQGAARGTRAVVGKIDDILAGVGRQADNLDYDALLDLARRDGGFTVDPRTGKAAKAEGFVVGGLGSEVRHPMGSVQASDLNEFARQNMETLYTDNARLGAWIDEKTGEMVFDVSEQLTGTTARQHAFTRGIARGEDAVRDMAQGQNIYITTPLGSPVVRADSSIIRPGDIDWISVDDMPYFRAIKEDVLARQAAGLDVTDFRGGQNADIFTARTDVGAREPWMTNRLTDPDALKLDSQSFYDNMLQTPHAKSFKASSALVAQELPEAERLARIGMEHGGHLWYQNQDILDVFVRAFDGDAVAARANFEWHMAINALSSNNSDPFKQVIRANLVDTLLHTQVGRELFFAAGRETPYAVQDAILKSYGAGNNSWADIHTYISRVAQGGTPMYDVNAAHKMQTFHPHLIGSPVNVTGDRWQARSVGMKPSLMGAPHHYAAQEWGTMQLTESLNAGGLNRLGHPDTQGAVWVGKQIEDGVNPREVTVRFSDIWMGGVRELAERMNIPFEQAQIMAARGELPLPEIIGMAGTTALVALIMGQTDYVDWSMSMHDEDSQLELLDLMREGM